MYIGKKKIQYLASRATKMGITTMGLVFFLFVFFFFDIQFVFVDAQLCIESRTYNTYPSSTV